MRRYQFCFPLALCLIAFPAMANDAAIVKCRAIAEANARLACYDAISLVANSPERPAKQSSGETTNAPATATQPTAAGSSTAKGTESTPKPAEFGFESRQARSTVDRIESEITGYFGGWSANSRIKLANGQVWQVTDDSARYLDLNNPKVAVRRGAFGAFYLEIQGTNHSPRVRRVE